uniref:LOB domain-containing protein n=1 Tax=Kalanchoe fedtschenkoi TaxID=63787 RepID=A0A7N0ZSH1_KALFE
MASASALTTSPCAACKFLRRKCQPECVFAPYFPPDQPQKFANVHKVFGASNVTKLLNELHTSQRDDAVNSLAYEADMRLRDPVYGCVGVISLLQHQLRQLQLDLACAKSELSKYKTAISGAAAAQRSGVIQGGGAHGGHGQHHHYLGGHGQYHHQYQVVRSESSFDSGNDNSNEDEFDAGGFLDMLSQFQQSAGRGGPGGEHDRRTTAAVDRF